MSNPPAIHPAATSVTAFIGSSLSGPSLIPTPVQSFAAFQSQFGAFSPNVTLPLAARQFFANGGHSLLAVRTPALTRPAIQSALQSLLASGHPPNLLAVPGMTDPAILGGLSAFCQKNRCFLIADAPANATSLALLKNWLSSGVPKSAWIAVYAPWLRMQAAVTGRDSGLVTVPPSATIAGIFARTDSSQGVWRTPSAGNAQLLGVTDLAVHFTDTDSAAIETAGINTIRTTTGAFSQATLLGARTLAWSTHPSDASWQYVPVRRLALFLEQSIVQGLTWVAFEPNAPNTWEQIRLSVSSFLLSYFRKGAFQGVIPEQAYFVKCDNSTTTPTDIANGVINIVVGFAPLKPSEFVVIQIGQLAAASSSSNIRRHH